MQRLRFSVIGTVLLLIFAAGVARSAEASVLVELLTAEGCSSCPPADRFLAQLDAGQPLNGARFIVLSEHVDYWDGHGWSYSYASKQLTERQRAYERRLMVREPFTPQFILDGTTDVRLGQAGRVSNQLPAAASVVKPALRIESLHLDAGSVPAMRGIVTIPPFKSNRPCKLFVAIVLDHAESRVRRGENRGQHLAPVAVLRQLERVAAITPGIASRQAFSIALRPELESEALRVIAFVQEAGTGAVLAVTEQTRLP